MILDDLRRFRASPEVPRLAVALLATAAVMLFAVASTSLPNPDKESEDGTSKMQSQTAQASGAELQSSGENLRRFGGGRQTEISSTQTQDAFGADRNRASKGIGGTQTRSQAQELTAAAPLGKCQHLVRGQWLYWSIEHKGDRVEYHHCEYTGNWRGRL